MSTRQLSAIMFSDLAGYTAMMQENEFNAIGLRDRWRTILEKEIKEHDGEIVQYYGDGALSIFQSTLMATRAAIVIQSTCVREDIPLRMGIHSGDIVVEEGGVFGDGVNIASRIESFSVPGSVMISEKVYDDLKNHASIRAMIMGLFDLKNVRKPMEVYALTNDGLVVPTRSSLKGKIKEGIKSIAVLPFVNRSSDPDNEYFSDGITEEIITALAKVEELRVISRTSSFSFKGMDIDVRDIGKQLEVQSVLEGSVRKSGNRVRVSAHLSSTFDGYEVWSESYDRLLEDIFEIQDEISGKIARQLREKLAVSPDKDSTSEKINLEAYNHYLKGLYNYHQWTPSSAMQAVEAFQAAIDLEPGYDKAYASMGLAYSLIGTTGYIDPSEGYKKAIDSCEAALRINPHNEIAFSTLSYVHMFYNWDFERGKRFAEKAIDINRKGVEANLAMTLYHIIKGQFENIEPYLNAARQTDPLSTLTNRTVADTYYFMGQYDKALELYEWLIQKEPGYQAGKEFKGWTLLMQGHFDEAIEIFLSIEGEATHAIKPFVQLGYAYALKGDRSKAEGYLDELKKFAQEHPGKIHDLDFATLYAGLGMADKALHHIERCLEQRLGPVVFLNVSPVWMPIRSHPEFQNLLDQIGL